MSNISFRQKNFLCKNIWKEHVEYFVLPKKIKVQVKLTGRKNSCFREHKYTTGGIFHIGTKIKLHYK